MSDFTQQEQQEDRAGLLSDELNQLIAMRGDGHQDDISPDVDPFGHVYVTLADVIIATSRMYIGLRRIEDMLSGGEK